MTLGEIGYWLATAAFVLLTALLCTAPLTNLPARLIRLFAAMAAVWAVANGWMLAAGQGGLALILGIEMWRNLLLQLALLALLRGSRGWRELRRERLLVPAALLWLLPQLALFLPLGGVDWLRGMVFAGLLGQTLLTLFLVEQNFRLLPDQARRPFLPFMLGVGAVLVFDFVLYAEGLLLLQLNAYFWDARGFVWAGAMPALLLTTRRLPGLAVRVFVSRQVVYHSTLLMAAGAYLLVMAGAGYYIRYFGGDWGHVMQIAFMALASLLLAAIFFSEAFRRKLKVFIFKHFYANRYDYRVEWLKLNRQLHERAADEALPLTVLRAMALVAHAPCACLYQRQGELITLAAAWPEEPTVALDQEQLAALFAFCERESWIVDVAEYARHRQRYGALKLDVALCQQQGVALWVPVYEGERVTGLFALGRHPEDPPINFEDRDLLNTVSSQLATYLALQQANDALTEARQFDAFNRMSAFLLHDLKNIVAQLNLIVLNARKHKHNPEFIDDSLETLANAVAKMQRIMQQLKKSEGGVVEATHLVDLAEVVQQAVARQQQLSPLPQLTLEGPVLVRGDGERLQSVLANLIQNGQEATAAGGAVRVRLESRDGWALVTVEDDGCGMSEQFVRERLFRPFDTTKGNAGMGIGAYEARQLVLALGGQFEVLSREGEGTRISVRLPVQG